MDKIHQAGPTMLAKQVPQLRVDVSSIAQGWTVGQLAKILEQAGVQNYLVEVGGELIAKGKKPEQQSWRVAMKNHYRVSRNCKKFIPSINLEALAVISSGTYRHYFDADGQRYSHVLDARSGAPGQASNGGYHSAD